MVRKLVSAPGVLLRRDTVKDAELLVLRKRTRAEARLRTATSTRRTQALAEQQIADLVNQAGDIVDVLRDAKPETKRQTYAALGLRCRYNHAQRKMQVRIAPDLHSLANFVGQWVVSEAGHRP